MEKIILKKASITDIPTIRDIAQQVFPLTYKEILSTEQIDFMMEWMYSEDSLKEQINGSHTFFIAYDKDSNACGYVSVEKESTHSFHLQKLYLLPKHHGSGIAALLMNTAIEFARKESGGSAILELNVNRQNHRAQKFYKKQGFSIARSVDIEIHPDFFMNDYIMALNI